MYFDPGNLVRLAVEGGCNAFASTLGVLGAVSRKWAHRFPFIVKLNHNELLTAPNTFDQIMFSSVQRAHELGAAGVGATIYFGSPEADRQIVEVAQAFEDAHRRGMFTVLWCYLRNPAFVVDGVDYHAAADLTGQANHLGVTIEADIIKQKLPDANGRLRGGRARARRLVRQDERLVYSKLTTDHPIDLTRYQLANCYMGRAPLINSGGASAGDGDLAEAVRTAVINKRAGGMGLISGRKAFQRPLARGHRAAARDPGRLPVRGRHDRVAAPRQRGLRVRASRPSAPAAQRRARFVPQDARLCDFFAPSGIAVASRRSVPRSPGRLSSSLLVLAAAAVRRRRCSIAATPARRDSARGGDGHAGRRRRHGRPVGHRPQPADRRSTRPRSTAARSASGARRPRSPRRLLTGRRVRWRGQASSRATATGAPSSTSGSRTAASSTSCSSRAAARARSRSRRTCATRRCCAAASSEARAGSRGLWSPGACS